MKPPLILTLAMEPEAFLFFNTLRQKYFPADRNFIEAHLTLFHALPNENTIIETIQNCCHQQAPFLLHITKPVSIGKGVAFKIESTELSHLHKRLQQQWQDSLTPQDRQKLWPHITVQNKVAVPEAQKTLEAVKKDFQPFATSALGLQVWEYLNGPWKLVQEFFFQLS